MCREQVLAELLHNKLACRPWRSTVGVAEVWLWEASADLICERAWSGGTMGHKLRFQLASRHLAAMTHSRLACA